MSVKFIVFLLFLTTSMVLTAELKDELQTEPNLETTTPSPVPEKKYEDDLDSLLLYNFVESCQPPNMWVRGKCRLVKDG